MIGSTSGIEALGLLQVVAAQGDEVERGQWLKEIDSHLARQISLEEQPYALLLGEVATLLAAEEARGPLASITRSDLAKMAVAYDRLASDIESGQPPTYACIENPPTPVFCRVFAELILYQEQLTKGTRVLRAILTLQ